MTEGENDETSVIRKRLEEPNLFQKCCDTNVVGQINFEDVTKALVCLK